MNQYHTTNVFPLILNLSPKSMLSLYIHIPFCRHKCKYCSFFVLPENDAQLVDKDMKLEQLKEEYLQSLITQNQQRKEQFPTQQLKTIYIGGGTPFELGAQRLFELIDNILDTWDTEFLEELSIELNPDPFDEVLDFIREANRRYKHLYKLRFSIGIQTFDDAILTESKRNYVFNNLIWFFRDLQKIKQPFTHYNFDFIAFGSGNQNTHDAENYLPRSEAKIEFFMKLVGSHVADGYSLYTLELFPGSARYNQLQNNKQAEPQEQKKIHRLQQNKEKIYEEFDVLKTIIQQSGYHRYEVSNFALASKPSIHNMVYRNMESYIGLGINSSSFLQKTVIEKSLGGEKMLQQRNMNKEDIVGIRFQNTKHRKKYLAHAWLDDDSKEPLDTQTYRTEKAFLALRMSSGLQHTSSYADIFEPQRKELLTTWSQAGLITYNEETDLLKLTDAGMNVYNGIITDLFSSL